MLLPMRLQTRRPVWHLLLQLLQQRPLLQQLLVRRRMMMLLLPRQLLHLMLIHLLI
jgi:hypothetical protein